jgi:GNAT superfamily N-acetyltransferase
MDVKTLPISKLSTSEINACKKLTLTYGLMRPAFEWLLDERDKDARVVLAQENNKIIGWALAFKAGCDIGLVGYEDMQERFGDREVHVFVDEKHRRRGIGKKLLGRIRMGYKEPILVAKHNTIASSFYSGVCASGRAINIWGV